MPKSDHDLLTEQSVILQNVSETLAGIKTDNKEDHAIINGKLDFKVNNSLFRWTIGFIIFSIMALTAYAGITRNHVIKNTTCIEKLEMRK